MQRLASTVIVATLATRAWAGTSEITRYTIAGGGGVSQASGYTLTGTIGQWDAHDVASAGSLELTGGFWGPDEDAPACLGDINGDGAVSSTDLAELLALWGLSGGPADLDGNGVVGSPDLAALLAAWGSDAVDFTDDGVASSGDLAILLAAWGPCP